MTKSNTQRKATTPTANVPTKAKAPKASPAPLKVIKGHVASALVGKPQKKMLATITKINVHPGKGLRVKRFHHYKKGMTLQQCNNTPGLAAIEVKFYVQHGLMELTPCTDKAFTAAETAWIKATAGRKNKG